MDKRLYRSRKDCTIGGVCGGLGDYFNIDPVFIRIVMVLSIFADGVGILAYLIGWIVIPRAPYEGETTGELKPETPEKVEYASWNKYIPGGFLILLGVFFIVRDHYWWWDVERFWPLLLVVFGVFLLLRLGRKQQKLEEGTNESGQI